MSVNSKDRKSELGMTLIELIMVVVILAMLVAALGLGLRGKLGQSREKINQASNGLQAGTRTTYTDKNVIASSVDETQLKEQLESGKALMSTSETNRLRKSLKKRTHLRWDSQ